MVLIESERLNGAARHTFEASARIDIAQIYEGILPCDIGTIWDHRRPLSLTNRDGLKESVVGLFFDQQQIVENIDQINPPQ